MKHILCFVFLCASAIAMAQPTNDNVCDAMTILAGVPVPFNNLEATAEPNEVFAPGVFYEDPEADCLTEWCDGTPAEVTVWFKYTATVSAPIIISTCSEPSFDSQLAVYTMGTCSDFSSFTLIGANDDMADGCTLEKGDYYASFLTILTITAGTTYYIQVDGWLATEGEAELLLIQLPVSVEETTHSFSLFPNPAGNVLNVNSNKPGMNQLVITDLSGRAVWSQSVSSNQTIDVSNLAPGMYQARWNGDTASVRFIKE